MIEAPCKSRTLMKDGAWIVPESERPENWREITERECILDPEPEPQIKAATQPEPEDPSFPALNPKYAPLLLPILNKLQAGLEAEREVLELTKCCMELQVWLAEAGMRRFARFMRDEPKSE